MSKSGLKDQFKTIPKVISYQRVLLENNLVLEYLLLTEEKVLSLC